MKKYICMVFVLVFSILLGSCNSTNMAFRSYTEYKCGIEVISEKCYYRMDSVDEFNDFCKSYYSNDLAKEKYNQAYFSTHSLVAFLISEVSGGNQHQIQSKGINSKGNLTLRVVLTNMGSTCDMAYWVVFYELSKNEMSNLSSITIQKENRDYELVNKNDYQTSLPIDMPSNFRIFIIDSNSLYFDSMTHQLKYGYGNETTLELSSHDLKAIYQLLRDIQFDIYPHMIHVGDVEANGNIIISITGTGVDGECWINGTSHLDVNLWSSHQELGMVINQILKDYIQIDQYVNKIE
ncbi:MAG: hypothetical protein NC182_06520 [Prevotella sp.]|nr:hypothetical protein [Staphylococcus sp.]MCM1350840.1 hypothetical protein [Prevotella sp.]